MVCLYNFLPRKKYFPRKVADKKEKLKFGWEIIFSSEGGPIMKPTCFAYPMSIIVLLPHEPY